MKGSRTAVKWREGEGELEVEGEESGMEVEGELEMEMEGELEVEVEGEMEVEFRRRSEEGREGMSAMNTSKCE